MRICCGVSQYIIAIASTVVLFFFFLLARAVKEEKRYILVIRCSKEVMDAPRCRFCEVFLTDADGNLQYQGLYTMIEKPNEDKTRLNLTKYDPKFPETSFLLQMNRRADEITVEHLNQDEIRPFPLNLEYPRASEITEASRRYVERELLQFEKSLYDALHTGNWGAVEAQINVDSFVDYYLINEFFQNTDAGLRSTYLHRDIENKICMGPVWDFDGAQKLVSFCNWPDTGPLVNEIDALRFMEEETLGTEKTPRHLWISNTSGRPVRCRAGSLPPIRKVPSGCRRGRTQIGSFRLKRAQKGSGRKRLWNKIKKKKKFCFSKRESGAF